MSKSSRKSQRREKNGDLFRECPLPVGRSSNKLVGRIAGDRCPEGMTGVKRNRKKKKKTVNLHRSPPPRHSSPDLVEGESRFDIASSERAI